MTAISMTRRTWLAGAAAALGGTPAVAQQDTPLVVYTAYEDGQMKPLVDGFEALNPGTRIRHFHQPGEELVTTLELELRARSPRPTWSG